MYARLSHTYTRGAGKSYNTLISFQKGNKQVTGPKETCAQMRYEIRLHQS